MFAVNLEVMNPSPLVSVAGPKDDHFDTSLPADLQGCTMSDYIHHVSDRPDLVAVVHAIKSACKMIAAEAARGSTHQSDKSVYEIAHELLVKELDATGCVAQLSSAFEPRTRVCSGSGLAVATQPLVPTSTLFPDNSPTGTLFVVYDASKCSADKDPTMQKGKNALAAGYCLYGSSTTFFLTAGDGVHVRPPRFARLPVP